MFFTGIIIAVMALAIIGVFHPIVIKTEYYTGVRYWWVFMLLGLLCLAAALFVEDIIGSAALGLAGGVIPMVYPRTLRTERKSEKRMVSDEPKAKRRIRQIESAASRCAYRHCHASS